MVVVMNLLNVIAIWLQIIQSEENTKDLIVKFVSTVLCNRDHTLIDMFFETGVILCLKHAPLLFAKKQQLVLYLVLSNEILDIAWSLPSNPFYYENRGESLQSSKPFFKETS